jgi:uncharacterized protein (TIGR03435 family)
MAMRLAVIFGTALLLFSVSPGRAEGPTFDAASVKITDPNLQQPYINTGGPGTTDPGHFRAPRIPLFNLLALAFGVSTDQLSCPSWIREVGTAGKFTVVATMPPDTTKEQFQKMLQNLLVERFHLVFHHEARNFPGYELVVDKGGPKFKEVTPTPQQDDATQPGPRGIMGGPRGDDGFPVRSGPFTMGLGGPGGVEKTKYQERSMSEFVSNLGFLIGSSQGKSVLDGYPQPRVADKTGLTGKYTFVLEYYSASSAALRSRLPALAQNAEGQGNPAGAASEPDAGGPNIFKAVQSELGLRLDKTPDVPLDVVVVESVDKVPTEN